MTESQPRVGKHVCVFFFPINLIVSVPESFRLMSEAANTKRSLISNVMRAGDIRRAETVSNEIKELIA